MLWLRTMGPDLLFRSVLPVLFHSGPASVGRKKILMQRKENSHNGRCCWCGEPVKMILRRIRDRKRTLACSGCAHYALLVLPGPQREYVGEEELCEGKEVAAV